jgi:hypothetical protein
MSARAELDPLRIQGCLAAPSASPSQDASPEITYEHNKQAAIVWTDGRVDILSFAWREDPNLPALFDAWRTGVGPDTKAAPPPVEPWTVPLR